MLGAKPNKLTKRDDSRSNVNIVSNINSNKVKPVKEVFNDKKRLIKLNNKKIKFTNFEDEDSDW